MRRRLAAAVLSSAILLPALRLVAQPALPPATQPSSTVPVKAVVLFSSGVGYFEHYGTVSGSGTTELRFKTQQVNDILKSLVLQDVDGGKVTAINYPSLDPIGKTLKSFQVDITTNPGLGDLLNQLRGAKVKLTAAGESREGTILGLEKKKAPAPASADKNAPPVADVWVMNLVTHGHIRSVYLDQVTDLELEDPRLQDELDKALAALAQSRDQDKKPVTIHFDGQGERHVRIGYVVETPIWKTSYRLVLGKKHQLQGWALVENQTDNDWKDVQLSLVSGRPISFIQDLYQPLYIPRPLVKPDLLVSLRPQTYEAGIDAQKNFERLQQGQKQMQQLQEAAQNRRGGNQQNQAGGRGGQNLFGNANSPADESAMDPTASVASIASASKVGELFQYTVGNVSLPRQQSAMIPIITDPIQVERLSIYNANTLSDHPLYGARIINSTGKHLLAGPITVIDGGSYAGDASIDNVPPGQSRLVSYGIDLQLAVNPNEIKYDQHLETAKLVKGVLETSTRTLETQEYVVQNKGDKDRTLIIEHPAAENQELVDTDKPIERTSNLYRFKGKVEAGKTWHFTVKQQSVNASEAKLMELDDQHLAYDVKADSGLPQQVRDALAKIVERRAALADLDRKLKASTQRIAEVTSEQQRIRENMKTVNQQQSDYYTRLLKKLNDQETLIEKVQGEAEETRQAIERQRKELEEFVQNLNVG